MRLEHSYVRHGRRLAVGLVLLAAAIGSILAARSAAQESPPLLVVVSVDGLQPDYVTAADAHGAKIPNLRRVLKDGAFAEGVEGVIPTVTYPSHTTLITGVWPVVDGQGQITDWKAMPWTAGGSAAIVLKDPSDARTRTQVRELLDALAREPRNGIDRVLEADPLHRRGGFPTASFLVGLKPGWRTGSSLTGPVLSKTKPSGTHGHLPDAPGLRASFFLVGPGVPAGRSLVGIDMRDVAPTLARRLGLALPAADGKILLP
jgi:predicted AlkP superfamily pyrophosphatase or phosphodiesterase